MRRKISVRLRRLNLQLVIEGALLIGVKRQRNHVQPAVKAYGLLFRKHAVFIQRNISVRALQSLSVRVNAAIRAYKHAYLLLLIQVGRLRSLGGINLQFHRVLGHIVVHVNGVHINAAVVQRAYYLYNIVGGNRLNTVRHYYNALYNPVVEYISRIPQGRAYVGRASVNLVCLAYVGHALAKLRQQLIVSGKAYYAHF